MKKILIILSLLMTFVLGCAKTVKTFEINAEPGTKVPNFELKDFKGVKTKSRKIFNNGKPTLFIVAAEWCPDCHMELPDVQKFYEENKDKINKSVIEDFQKGTMQIDGLNKMFEK